MKQTITQSQFIDAFRDYGREDNFSYAGLMALHEWLEQYEKDTGIEIELDVIALCCEFVEYENMAEFVSDYGYTKGSYIDGDDISDLTTIIPIDETAFIMQAF